jgi:hypothetical protein
MRPLDMDNLEPRALEINRKTKEELEEAPLQEVVWKQFATFCAQFTLGGKSDGWSAPIAAGYNINNYDMPIVQRLCESYKMLNKEGYQSIFHNVHRHDLMPIITHWFNGQKEPVRYNMDALRDYFGLSKENAHDALQDVLDTAAILSRFMKLTRTLQNPDKKPRITFKNAFAEAVATK